MARVLFKMLAFIAIARILTAHVQTSLPDEEEHDSDETELVSDITIHSSSTAVVQGENVTLKCSSRTGSPPINYVLYKGQDRMLHRVSKNKKGDKAEFNLTINSISDLGEYKCKAENKYNKKYSPGFNFNFTMREPVSQPEIHSPSTEVRRGQNVTLSCLSRTGSLPIKYTLYRGKVKVQRPAIKNKMGEAAEFHVPVNSIGELGEYKCKAENNFTDGKYSLAFNFTMTAGEDNNLVVFIAPPLLLLLLLLALVLAIPLLILPWCKARKLRDISPTGFVPARDPSLQNDLTYAEIAHEKNQEEYVNFELSNKKGKHRQASFRDTTTVTYSEVIRR